MRRDAVLSLHTVDPVSQALQSMEPLLGFLETRGKLQTLVEAGYSSGRYNRYCDMAGDYLLFFPQELYVRRCEVHIYTTCSA